MSSRQQCPVCRPNFNGTALVSMDGDRMNFDCNVCGQFVASSSVIRTSLGQESRLSVVERAVLVNRVRRSADSGTPAMITTQTIKDIREGATLPSVSLQVMRLIETIGTQINATGEAVPMRGREYARAGCLNSDMGTRLVRDLVEDKILIGGISFKYTDEIANTNVSTQAYTLSLRGWERFEKLGSGQSVGNYAFIAMQFGDDDLDAFVSTHVKDHIRTALGFEVVDMRDVSRAGIIDNLMRAQIRDSAFVLVDLTHDNSGAYWEAGFAEGLGKPVIYICEREKFNEKATHFDTNHCTTVIWDKSDPNNFRAELLATIRRSLGYPEGPAE